MKIMNDVDLDNERRKHIIYKILIAVIVTTVVVSALVVEKMYDNEEKIERNELIFEYANATVSWIDDYEIQIDINALQIYNINIIGENKTDNIRIEERHYGLIGERNRTYFIEKMMLDDMDIYIEIHNLRFDIVERQKLIEKKGIE